MDTGKKKADTADRWATVLGSKLNVGGGGEKE